MDLKKIASKNNLTNIALSLVAALIAYYAFNYFNPGVEDMFSSVIFILILILLEVGDKK